MNEKEWLEKAVKFNLDNEHFIESRGQIEGPDKWVLKFHGQVMTKDGEWILEPMPSSRTALFIKMTRFDSKEDALVEMLKEQE